MRSDNITVSMENLTPALNLIERTSDYIGYSHDYSARMRLVGEELLRSVSFILSETEGTLWVETDETNMSIHLKVDGNLCDSTRQKLIEVSKKERNEPPKGIFARIGAFLADAMMADSADYVPYMPCNAWVNGDYAPISLMMEYDVRPQMRQAQAPSEPNDIELSLLKGLADDVRVAARAAHAEIIVLKKLP